VFIYVRLSGKTPKVFLSRFDSKGNCSEDKANTVSPALDPSLANNRALSLTGFLLRLLASAPPSASGEHRYSSVDELLRRPALGGDYRDGGRMFRAGLRGAVVCKSDGPRQGKSAPDYVSECLDPESEAATGVDLSAALGPLRGFAVKNTQSIATDGFALPENTSSLTYQERSAWRRLRSASAQ